MKHGRNSNCPILYNGVMKMGWLVNLFQTCQLVRGVSFRDVISQGSWSLIITQCQPWPRLVIHIWFIYSLYSTIVTFTLGPYDRNLWTLVSNHICFEYFNWIREQMPPTCCPSCHLMSVNTPKSRFSTSDICPLAVHPIL